MINSRQKKTTTKKQDRSPLQGLLNHASTGNIKCIESTPIKRILCILYRWGMGENHEPIKKGHKATEEYLEKKDIYKCQNIWRRSFGNQKYTVSYLTRTKSN